MRLCSNLTTRPWTVALIICISLMTSECQDLKQLNNVFSESILNQPVTAENVKCNDIRGSIRGCYDCYLCSEPQITNRVNKDSIVTPIAMIDDTCRATDICCIHQTYLVTRYGFTLRGTTANAALATLRDITEVSEKVFEVSCPENILGEPGCTGMTRAFVEHKRPLNVQLLEVEDDTHVSSPTSSNSRDAKPICSATYISFEAQALITSATCVSPYADSKLFVRFSESGAFLDVDQKIIHENYKSEFHYNDIAILTLKSLEGPKWVAPCCLPTEAPRFGTPCIAVSADNYYINVGIPHEKHCRVDNVSMHESHMCAVAPRRDYTPETGSALICLEEREKSPIYIVYGIALHKSGEEITMYTNVKNFSDWIEIQLGKKQNMIHSYYG